MSSRKWVPGQSGNPKGRPGHAQSLAAMVREATHDGADLVKHAVRVWKDYEATDSHRQWAHDCRFHATGCG